jgi:hypothetical protein
MNIKLIDNMISNENKCKLAAMNCVQRSWRCYHRNILKHFVEINGCIKHGVKQAVGRR